jgi:hypothetical protein
VPNTLGLALSIALAGTQMLFFYLICSRSLLEVTKTREGFFVEAKKPTEADEQKKEAFEDMKKAVDAAKKGAASHM